MTEGDYHVVNLSAENLYDVEVYGSADEDLEDVEAAVVRLADKAKKDVRDARKVANGKEIQ